MGTDAKPVRGRRSSVSNLVEDLGAAKHMAELLELSGANKISQAVQLQLEAMKADEESGIVRVIDKWKGQQKLKEALEGPDPNLEAQGGLVAAMAANKMKAKVKRDRLRRDSDVSAVVADMVLGEFEGPKAGPLRWVFRREELLDIWEWQAFHAAPWMLGIVARMSMRAAAEFPDSEVSSVCFATGHSPPCCRANCPLLDSELCAPLAPQTGQALAGGLAHD